MRVLWIALMLLLAGCADASEDPEPPADLPSSDAAETGASSEVESSADAPLPRHLGNATCPLEDRPVYTTAGVRTDGAGTSSRCALQEVEIPETTRSVRLTFTYTAQSHDDFGIRLYHPDRCTQTSSGDECSIAEAFGPSPVVLDVDSETLGDYVLEELDAYAVGYGVDTELDLELAFYSSDAP